MVLLASGAAGGGGKHYDPWHPGRLGVNKALTRNGSFSGAVVGFP